ncbi:TRAPP III complex Trs85 [Trinorchestia longiramus]|nr:TRAPP III complex Trs85 [Trinorchestia longiramus]
MDSSFPKTAKEYIQWVFSPHVGVFCDEEAENSCLRNNLKFVDLIQPFCKLPDEVGISDPNRCLITLKNFRLVLQDINTKPPVPAVAKKILKVSFDDLSTPWYDKWKEAFHQLQHPFDHEFTKHLLACIFATNLGIRLLLVACEVLQANKQHSEAAMYYIKLTSEDSDLLSALMLEQAASCFLKAGLVNKSGMRRKFAFHMTLAGHRYSKAGQKLLSLRANVLASKVMLLLLLNCSQSVAC